MSKPYLSISQIDTYLQCGERYRRRYIEREKPKPPAIGMVVGTAVHYGAAQSARRFMEAETFLEGQDVIDEALTEFDRQVERDGVSIEDDQDHDRAIGLARDQIAQSCVVVSDTVLPQYRPIRVEHRFQIELPEIAHNFVGVVDMVDRSGIVVDYKTAGKRKNQSEADHSRQLTAYAAWYYREFEALPTEVRLEVIIQSARKGQATSTSQTITSERDESDLLALEQTVYAVSAGIESGTFLPAKPGTDWWCSHRFCEFFETCPYVSKRTLVQIGGE